MEIDVPLSGAPEQKPKRIKVKATRLQVPLVIQNASTLYTLQGATADPGLIFQWRFPAKLTKEMRWLTVCMTLSRVRSLEQFRSIGLKDTVKALINDGPPSGMLGRFALLFDEKVAQRRMSLPTQRCQSLDGEDADATQHCMVQFVATDAEHRRRALAITCT